MHLPRLRLRFPLEFGWTNYIRGLFVPNSTTVQFYKFPLISFENTVTGIFPCGIFPVRNFPRRIFPSGFIVRLGNSYIKRKAFMLLGKFLTGKNPPGKIPHWEKSAWECSAWENSAWENSYNRKYCVCDQPFQQFIAC